MARTNDVWETGGTDGSYIQTISPTGFDILINGTSKYLNFNTTVGVNGYGIRDNGGTMQFRNFGGSWTDFGSGGGGGTVTSVASADGSITVTNPTTTVDLAVVKAPILSTARTIGGVSFNGSANITVATATGGFTISGGDLALGANNITMTGSLGATGARLTKGWFTDLQVTNAIAGSITGNAATVTNATLTTALTVNTGTLTLTANAANTSVLTIGAGAVSVSGANTGDQTITLTGAVTGSGTGSFATTLATPGTLTVSSANSNITAHTHAITSSSAPGAVASLLATDSSGIIGSTGTRIVKIWATDLTVTNNITGSITGNAATVTTNANLTGDITSSGNATTLATVNSNVGSFGSVTQVATFTVNGKGLTTAAANVTITPAVGSITGLGTGVATALAVNIGTAGSFVVNGGALGTPSSGTISTGVVLGGVTMTLGSDASFDIYYRNGSGVLTRLANSTTGNFLGANTGAAPSWQTPAGGGGLTVGTSTIASGTTTRILYDNAGVLGEYTISGSGTVVAMAASPIFTTPTLGAAIATTIAIGTINYTPSNPTYTAQGSVNSYIQSVMQNTSTGTTGSVDFVVNNSISTDSTNYGDFGMNSSGFTGASIFNQPSYVFLTSTTVDLAIGTTTSNAIHFVVNNGTTDAMTISSGGVTSLGTPLGAGSGGTGIANNAASTITISGAFATTFNVQAVTNITLQPDGVDVNIGLGTALSTSTYLL